ncbi:MAG: hypothetical protein ABIZ04_05760 [Opitutus sp.]
MTPAETSTAPAIVRRGLRPTRRTVFGAALAAAMTTALAWWALYLPEMFPYALEVSIQSIAPASTQVYFDRGEGLREMDSSAQRIAKGTTRVHLSLPAGNYHALRFDPIDRGGTVSFGELQIVSRRGKILRRVPPTELTPNQQIESTRMIDGMLEMKSTATADDPQFSFTFEPTLQLKFGVFDQLTAGWGWLLRWFLSCLLLFLAIENMWCHRVARSRSLVALSRERPRLALALFAGLAAIVSSYPVVFFGKSFVSPNTTHLLYDALPSVPGYTDARAERPRGADIGAMMWQHLPYTVQQSHALKAGEWPLWNRYTSCGLTLLGQGQSMIGDPLNFLVVLTGGATWAFDFKYVLIKALFACGLGWCVWALTRDFAAAAILTFASVFIAFFNYRLSHPSIFTMGYSPWILVAWLHLTGAVDRRAFRHALLLWFGPNWMVITSGTIKEAYMLACALNFTGALIFLNSADVRGEKWRRAGFVVGAGISFILASCPLWWTFLEALSSAYTAYDVPGLSQVPGARLIGLFDDIFYREFMPSHDVFKPAANFLIFLGVLCAVLQPRRLTAARPMVIVAITSVIAVALAFRFGPPSWAPVWLLVIPFVRNIYNFDTIFSCVAVVHLCVLAGWGFSAARQPLKAGLEGKYLQRMALITVALFIPYFIANPSYPLPAHEWNGWSTMSVEQAVVYAHVLLLPLAAAILIVLTARTLRGRTLTGRGATLAVVALVVLLGRHGQHLALIPSTLVAAPATRAGLLETSPTVRLLQQKTAEEPGRVMGAGRSFFAGFTSIYGLEQITGANALENRRHRQLVEAAGLVAPGQWIYELPASDRARWRPITNFLNTRYLAAPDKFLPSTEGYHKIASLDFDVFESEHCWPRAFFTTQLERYDGAARLVGMIRDRATAAPFAAVQDGEEGPERLPLVTPPIVQPAGEYELSTNRTAFTVVTATPGYAILHENWLPDDFRATLDGKPVPYFRVNHTFKGIVLPKAGRHRIQFEYWPRGFTRSLIAGAIGFVLMAILLFATRWLRMRSSDAPVTA